MRTDDPRNITPNIPSRPGGRPVSAGATRVPNDAAVNVVRGQIDRIFQSESQPESPSPASTPQTQAPQAPSGVAHTDSPYARSHSSTPAADQSTKWKEYHSAWQNYYQQYYQRYYMAQTAQESSQPAQKDAQSNSIGIPTAETFTEDQAIDDLRGKLRAQVEESARKVRKSRHFYPITAALLVMGTFLFLQYNSIVMGTVKAYMSPGNINPTNIIVGVNPDAPVGPEPKLIIPKINVDVPVDFNATPDHNTQMAAMEHGVAWFGIPGANSKPGQVGNTPISGHSSNDILSSGQYKYIFAKLDQLVEGDTFYINYEGKRYTYAVTKSEVVRPSQIDKLIYPTDKPVVTLITCTPLGTSLNRLLVTAEQISPDPSGAAAASTDATGATPDPSRSDAIPGQSPTLFERLFGAN